METTQAAFSLDPLLSRGNQINSVECTRVNGIVVFADCACANLNGAWKRDDKAIGGRERGT